MSANPRLAEHWPLIPPGERIEFIYQHKSKPVPPGYTLFAQYGSNVMCCRYVKEVQA